MSHDMMPGFELLQPTKLTDALSLLGSRGNDIWKMAGGNDSLDWFKDRVKRPKAVMDIGGIAELKGIRETADGVCVRRVGTGRSYALSRLSFCLVAPFYLLRGRFDEKPYPSIASFFQFVLCCSTGFNCYNFFIQSRD